MKKHFFLLTLLSLLISTSAFADDVPISVDQLPSAAKTFVQDYFKGGKILYAEKDHNSFECRLDDGTEIEFDSNGEWNKVDRRVSAVPEAIIPAPVSEYVKANYANFLITKLEKKRYGYEAELSNGIELMFNAQGAFIGMDD